MLILEYSWWYAADIPCTESSQKVASSLASASECDLPREQSIGSIPAAFQSDSEAFTGLLCSRQHGMRFWMDQPILPISISHAPTPACSSLLRLSASGV